MVWSRRPSGCAGSRPSLMAAMTAARMVARLTGPLPVRLVAASSPKLTSRGGAPRWTSAREPGGPVAGQAGDGVDGRAGGPAGGGVLPPAGDLDGLAGAGEPQVADVGGLQGPGLGAACPVSRAETPTGTCRQGRALTCGSAAAGCSSRSRCNQLSCVLDQPGQVGAHGMEGIEGHHGAGQVRRSPQLGEIAGLVVLDAHLEMAQEMPTRVG